MDAWNKDLIRIEEKWIADKCVDIKALRSNGEEIPIPNKEERMILMSGRGITVTQYIEIPEFYSHFSDL